LQQAKEIGLRTIPGFYPVFGSHSSSIILFPWHFFAVTVILRVLTSLRTMPVPFACGRLTTQT